MPDVPRWTICDEAVPASELRWTVGGRRVRSLTAADLPIGAWVALAQCVRDADTLRKARELARAMRTPTCRVNATTGQISDLLDLLTQETPNA